MVRNPDYIHINSDAALGDNCRLFCTDSYLGKPTNVKGIFIGKNFHATRNLTIQCAGTVRIGDNVLIASDVFIIDYNHGLSPLKDSYLDNELEIKNVIIEDGCWIGNSVIILPGVKIGKKSIIGAGAVCSKDIPDYSMAVGNPVKIIKKFDQNKKIWVPISSRE